MDEIALNKYRDKNRALTIGEHDENMDFVEERMKSSGSGRGGFGRPTISLTDADIGKLVMLDDTGHFVKTTRDADYVDTKGKWRITVLNNIPLPVPTVARIKLLGIPTDGMEVSFPAGTYDFIFKTVATDPNHILIGADAEETRDNMLATLAAFDPTGDLWHAIDTTGDLEAIDIAFNGKTAGTADCLLPPVIDGNVTTTDPPTIDITIVTAGELNVYENILANDNVFEYLDTDVDDEYTNAGLQAQDLFDLSRTIGTQLWNYKLPDDANMFAAMMAEWFGAFAVPVFVVTTPSADVVELEMVAFPAGDVDLIISGDINDPGGAIPFTLEEIVTPRRSNPGLVSKQVYGTLLSVINGIAYVDRSEFQELILGGTEDLDLSIRYPGMKMQTTFITRFLIAGDDGTVQSFMSFALAVGTDGNEDMRWIKSFMRKGSLWFAMGNGTVGDKIVATTNTTLFEVFGFGFG